MKPYLFLDLDDTIFQTRRKCPSETDLRVAASSRDGNPLSFMTSSQQTIFKLWSEMMYVIPTTARSLDAFRRVHLKFEHGAILDYGGVILKQDGTLDYEWDTTIRQQVQASRSCMNDVMVAIKEYAVTKLLSISIRIISDYNMDLYIVIKQPDADISILRELHAECVMPITPAEFYVHFNDNNIAVIPRFLNKANAVKYLIDCHLRPANDLLVTLGMGDSLSDLDFMGMCDYLITPSSSQISRALL